MTQIPSAPDQQANAWDPNAHCLALDGIRGCAIVAVTLYRLCKEFDPESHPVLSMIRRFAPIGERGVDLFFVLSGFLITGILLRTRSQPNYFRNFIVRRVLRIFPLYFLSLFLGILVIPKLFSTDAFDLASREQFYLWTYTSNFRMAWLNEWCFGAFDHFWSLAVEEHFYLIWPLVVLLLNRRLLSLVCIVLIGVVCLARTFAALDSRFDVAVSVATFFRADGLCFGAMLAILLTSSIDRKTIRRAGGIILALLMPLLIGVAISGKRFLEIPNTLCPATCFAAITVILLSNRRSILVQLMESGWLRALGKYSYGMYVIQLPLLTLMPMRKLSGILPTNPLSASIAYVIGMFAMIVLIAMLSFHFYESHFLRLKKRYE